jgi:hypothetical protein
MIAQEPPRRLPSDSEPESATPEMALAEMTVEQLDNLLLDVSTMLSSATKPSGQESVHNKQPAVDRLMVERDSGLNRTFSFSSAESSSMIGKATQDKQIPTPEITQEEKSSHPATTLKGQRAKAKRRKNPKDMRFGDPLARKAQNNKLQQGSKPQESRACTSFDRGDSVDPMSPLESTRLLREMFEFEL